MSVSAVLDKINKCAARLRETYRQNADVPHQFSAAAKPDEDVFWQGDLGIMLTEKKIPSDYIRVEPPNKQLVPGTTSGARHVLESTDGVEMYLPPGWGQDESLAGPVVLLKKETVVTHPVHQHVQLPPGQYQFRYQRNYDEQLKREQRARD